ncbi:hypothetical protein COLO4_36951 [Corchorus olitorius]|uniref:Protein kinase domain-containing protein n=1 Tax=Corchorus olitorius TaxID=93759 RepID=A0A1R3G437_9ROSI|nr:hypothetical protein COLO4_36951 [Corchorus olitorius]
MTQLIAPDLVYATAERMATEAAQTVAPKFNLTWVMNVDASFSYHIRMQYFCDIVSKPDSDLYFNVYINGFMGVSGLDLSSETGEGGSRSRKMIILAITGLVIAPNLHWCSKKGLHYLHTCAAKQGRDVKTTNILLDENFKAKVADFGLSKSAAMEQGPVSTAVKGSFGYLDPKYFRRQQLTEKSDIYSFGVVLLEVLSTRVVICQNCQEKRLVWQSGQCSERKGMIQKIIDPKIAWSINEESLKKFVEAVEKCLGEYGVDRPSMGDVLWSLECSLQLQVASS